MKADNIRRVAVVGAGLMGHGIAQEFALAGYEVHLHDLAQEVLSTALDRIDQNVQRLSGAAQAERALGMVHATTDLETAVADVDVVVEAISEDLELKQQLFRRLDQLCHERTILASNSSTFMPSQTGLLTERRDRVLVTHYFNPPYLIPLVEVVRSKETSDQTAEAVYGLLVTAGKLPVVLDKEVPGFVVNRLQIALLRECVSLVESGVATPQVVDTIVKSSFGRRLSVAGPFEVFEAAGWDVISAIAAVLLPDIDSSRDLPDLLRHKVERGELGVKTGRGFYD